MSGPAIHYIVGKRVAAKYRISVNRAFDSYLNAGTLGPDFLFFNTKDMHPAIHRVYDLYCSVADFIEPFAQKVEEVKGTIDQVIAYSSLGSQAQQLLGEINNNINALEAIVQEAVTKHITDAVDVFSLLEHPIQAGTPLAKWWWFDTLHYRKTSEFSQALLSMTGAGTMERAYAIGYLSHIASDAVGHSVVNMIAGGPYRYHAQRHKVIESFQDVSAFQRYEHKEFVQSKLHESFLFGGAPDLPDSLCKLILDAMKQVYGSSYGSKLNSDDLKKAYRLWYDWFKKTTDTGTLPPPEPYSLSGDLQEVWNQFVNNTEGIWDLLTGGGSHHHHHHSLWGLLKALAAAILAPILIAAAIIDFILGSIATIGLAPAHWLLSICYQSLYDSFMKYRLGVALNGLAYPTTAHLCYPAVQHMLDPRIPDLENRRPTVGEQFPHVEWQSAQPELNGADHLLHPRSAIELPATTPCADLFYNDTALLYIDGAVPFSSSTLDSILAIDETNLGNLVSLMRGKTLGNAVVLTQELFSRFGGNRPLPDFNLDSDRGAGYRCWRVVPEDVGVRLPVDNIDII